jgi:hypothetical protein
MPKPNRSGQVLVTVYVSPELRDAVKKRAAERGTNISEATRDWMRRYSR